MRCEHVIYTKILVFSLQCGCSVCNMNTIGRDVGRVLVAIRTCCQYDK